MEKNSYKTRQTAFMAVCFFKYKRNGMPYSATEIFNKMNRKQFDSYDFTYGKDKKLIRDERLGLSKLKKMITHQFKGNYLGGYIVASKRDVKIYTFGQDGVLKALNEPNFSHEEKKNEVVLIGITPIVLYHPNTTKNFIPNNYESLGDKFRKTIGT